MLCNISAVLSQPLTTLIADYLAVTNQAVKTQTGSETYLYKPFTTFDHSSSAGKELHNVPQDEVSVTQTNQHEGSSVME